MPLRNANESAVLEVSRDQGSIYQTEVARRLRLSPPSIIRGVANRIEQGLAPEHCHSGSRGRGRPCLHRFNFRPASVIGVFI